jgi:hypothetical protein
MDGQSAPATVSRIAVLNQVSVLVLGAAESSIPLTAGLAEVIDGPSNVVVVDCLRISRLGHHDREQLVLAHRMLGASRRHLIVVNAPAGDVPSLREHGVDVAATVDQDFGVSTSTSGYAHGPSLI